MWSHPQWPGRHIPSGQGDSLRHYATWCNAVEGNTTFYAVPGASTINQWSEQAPTDFRFCFKLPRTITHDRRLRQTDAELSAFLTVMEPLAERCGPLLIQMPPSFSGDDHQVLASFLTQLPADWQWAVEVRHPDFFPGGDSERRLNDALADRSVNRVLLDSRPLFAGPRQTPGEIEAFANKPRVPIRPVATGSNPIVRFIGQTDLDASARHWDQWVDKIAEWLVTGLEPYFFAHTPDNIEAPVLNRRFHGVMAKHLPTLAPLPEPVTPATQMDLFGRRPTNNR